MKRKLFNNCYVIKMNISMEEAGVKGEPTGILPADINETENIRVITKSINGENGRWLYY